MNEIFGDLWAETREVVDAAHGLLEGPVGEGQLFGTYDTERICLDLPKGLLLVAAYAAIKQKRGHAPGEWTALREELGNGSETWRRLMRDHLSHILWNALQWELHRLAEGDHPVMVDEAKRRGTWPEEWEPELASQSNSELDDEDVPF